MPVDDRYARHVALEGIGAAGQQSIGASTVLIVGVGGLGCPAAQYLAASGIGRLVLNDFDRVDETNLPRQILFADADIGALKVEAAASRLRDLNPALEVIALSKRLSESEISEHVRAVDIVLDCTDTVTTRLAINRAAVAASVPLVSGAALRFEGQLAVFANRGGGPCYRCIYSEDDEMLGSCQGNGVLAPVPGVIGTLMAVEALQIAAHRRSGLEHRLQLWDAAHGEWQTLGIRPNPDCPVCSK
jgi:molybdopterin/thiamine biosynthesis adenylyltransferase